MGANAFGVLRTALSHPDPAVQLKCALVLVSAGVAEAVDVLLAQLPAVPPETCENIIDALGAAHDPRSVPALRAIAAEGPSWRAAMKALSTIPQPDTADFLETLLANLDADVALAAAEALRDLGFPGGAARTIPELLHRALTRAEWALGRLALKCGEKYSIAPSLEQAKTLIAAEDSHVRELCAVALGRMRGPGTTPLLVRALEDPVHKVKAAAATALGKLGDASAEGALIAVVRTSRFASVRENALLAIHALRHNGEALDPVTLDLMQVAKGDLNDTLSMAAFDALLGSPVEVSQKDLQVWLKNATWQVRRNMARVLDQLRIEGTVPILVNALKDSEQGVREAAARTLGRIADPSALDALLRICWDKEHGDSDERRAAIVAALGTCLGSKGIHDLSTKLVDAAFGDARGPLRQASACWLLAFEHECGRGCPICGALQGDPSDAKTRKHDA